MTIRWQSGKLSNGSFLNITFVTIISNHRAKSDFQMLCLDILVPRCVQQLISEPPVCLSNEQDIKTVSLIRDFGDGFGRRRDEIDQACRLASGPSDVVIFLERPHESQTYHGTFGEFVKRCKTLKSVDELIRFSSKGARNIHIVTVLDAFSFKPKNREDSRRIPSERCHQLIEQCLELKSPKLFSVVGINLENIHLSLNSSRMGSAPSNFAIKWM
ncbi:hypothetical protein F53441_13464 [Fusarium austroafricanum]|uniref:Uncharacterized protein n=1 Tax=Fusarium austroafricanum TaxID=2364996 RepID=A0A8H4JNT0_9HYPO|nr:hypothetical protein F53441_13464 [Fusarium austroafricanum]